MERQKSLVNQYTTQYNKLKPELLEARRLDIGIVNARQVEQESRKTLTDLQDKIKVHQKIQDSRYSRILQQRELDDKLKEWFRKNRQHEQMCLNIKLIESFLDTAYTQRLQVIENQSLYTSTLQQLTVSRQQLELQRREIETSIQRHNDLLQLRQQQQISVNRFPISELRNRKEQLRLQRERLLQEIQKNQSVHVLDQYEKVLKKYLPNEIRDMYVQYVKKESTRTSDRKSYKYLISYLKKITKYPDGKKIARDIAECWKQDYKRRPAMMDELRKAGF